MEPFRQPLQCDGERVWRSYLGGSLLDLLHGRADAPDGSFPEEWMLSTTRARNPGRSQIEEGICHLSGSDRKVSLRELIAAHPEKMLGKAHAAEYGDTPGILVKLIDSLERLVVQGHPNTDGARKFFNSRFGKTECWHILGLRNQAGIDPRIYLGFRKGVTRETWRDAFLRQDKPALLGMMHRFKPAPGDTFIVHGGVPHAIGPGCLLVEIQEPTDFTFSLERRMDSGLEIPEESCHLGIGIENMFDCFLYEGRSEAETASAWRLERKTLAKTPDYLIESLVDYDVTPCFRMDRALLIGRLDLPPEDQFFGLYVEGGNGMVEHAGGKMPLAANDQVFFPAARGAVSIVSADNGEPLSLLRFYGPKAAHENEPCSNRCG
ncbi:MAG: class I mannose-6-phosphate isomerase [Planctomycetota bacterium]|nr:class I mannose-6-phosphate isomerase [Planctomycetota bacterium]